MHVQGCTPDARNYYLDQLELPEQDNLEIGRICRAECRSTN